MPIEDGVDDLDDFLDDEEGSEEAPVNPLTIQVDRRHPDEGLMEAGARTMLRPTIGAALSLIRLGEGNSPDLDLMSLVDALSEQTDAVVGGEDR